MKKQNEHPRLVHLDDDEITEPIQVIHDFFSVAWLPDQLDRLKHWRNQVAFAQATGKSENPAHLLYDYELTVKLVEAAWLLKDQKPGKLAIDQEKEAQVAKWYLKKERKTMRDYPTHLSTGELLKPATVLKRMFKAKPLTEYRSILRVWLHDALSTSFTEESVSKADVITVHEQLVKLVEATWLIGERSKTIS